MNSLTIETIRACLANAQRPVVLTGAGISAPSGIKTFRKDGEKEWDDAENESLARITALEDLSKVWTYWDSVRRTSDAASPNPAHQALADWEAALSDRGGTLTIVTQNVDNLHRRAGSTNVFPVHGTVSRGRCLGCGKHGPLTDKHFEHHGAVPRCPSCRVHQVRPDIVLFGEDLHHVGSINQMLATTDLLLVVGTSGTVTPICYLPALARSQGIPCILINEEPWPDMSPFTAVSYGNAAEILPVIYPK